MKLKAKKGFSIIELSVSLIIIGIIILAVMSSLQAIGENMAATKTEVKLDKMSNAVINNIISATSSSTVIASGSRDLRLPSQADVADLFYELDGYGNTYDYIPAQSLLDLGSSGNICTTTDTKFTLHIKEKGSGAYAPMSHIAFVIIGKGANLKRDYDNSTAGVVKLDRNSKNDDVFRYVTLDELKYRAGCSVARNTQLEILVKELPPLAGNSINRVYTTPLKPDNAFGLIWAYFCVETKTPDDLRHSIVFAARDLIDEDFTYPLRWQSKVLGKLQCGDDDPIGGTIEMGVAILIARNEITTPIPGTYHFKVRVITNDLSNFAVQDYVLTVLDE